MVSTIPSCVLLVFWLCPAKPDDDVMTEATSTLSLFDDGCDVHGSEEILPVPARGASAKGEDRMVNLVQHLAVGHRLAWELRPYPIGKHTNRE
jgi:hypothetical protein